jgi:hypothetical protein
MRATATAATVSAKLCIALAMVVSLMHVDSRHKYILISFDMQFWHVDRISACCCGQTASKDARKTNPSNNSTSRCTDGWFSPAPMWMSLLASGSV